jgi:hypothetical protein
MPSSNAAPSESAGEAIRTNPVRLVLTPHTGTDARLLDFTAEGNAGANRQSLLVTRRATIIAQGKKANLPPQL